VPTPPSDVSSGSRLWGGRWRAVGPKPLSARGKSEIWLVRDEKGVHPDVCVLKSLRPGKSLTETAARRFQQEIDTTRRLADRGAAVVPVLDSHFRAATEEAQSYYVMLRYPATLETECRSHAGDAVWALEKTRAVAVTLRDIHTDTIHRDIKPANVLLDGPEHRPLVADFGICFVHADERLTRTENQTLGTDDFVAPELQGGGKIEDVSAAVDVYSLGKTLYALMSGGYVFKRELSDDARWDLTRRFPNDFSAAHVAAIVRRMVRYEAGDRPTMDEVIALLTRARENIGNAVRYSDGMYDTDTPPPDERAERIRRRLRSVGEAERSGVVLAETEACVDSLDRAIRDKVARSGSFHSVHAEALAPLLPIAAAVADEVLAPSVAALDLAMPEKVIECVSRLSRRPGSDRPHEYDPALMVHEAGVIAAYVILGAIAWRRRSALVLAHVVQTYAERAHHFTHVTLLGRGSASIAPWIEKVAEVSRVLAASPMPQSKDGIKRALSAVHGLAALRWCLSSLTAERLVALGRTDRDAPSLDIPWLPGLHIWMGPSWLKEVSQAFLDDRRWEEDASQAALRMSAMGLRDRAKAATPLLARASGHFARQILPGRDFQFSWQDGAEEWKQWTESTRE